MNSVPRFAPEAPPIEVLRGIGNWLSQELGHEWRFLRSRGTVKRTKSGYAHEIHLQGSVYNRTGESILVLLFGWVGSRALAAWRLANADRVLGDRDRVYGTYVTNLLSGSMADFDLTDETRRQTEVPRMLGVVVDIVLPWLNLSLEPDRFLERASSKIVDLDSASLLEWFLSLELFDAAQALVEHRMETPWNQGLLEGAAMAAEGIRPMRGNSAVEFGWVASKFGLSIPVVPAEWRLATARVHRDAPDVDEHGFLDPGGNYGTASSVTTSDDVGPRTYFQRFALESALWSFGEDELLARVERAVLPEEVERIGRRHAELIYTADPAVSSGAGHPFDEALAMAAVEVLEGSPRALARQRRRPN